jgi:hypothetical protein
MFIGAGVLLLLAVPIGLIVVVAGANDCTPASSDPTPSSAAQHGIPANYLALYRAAGEQYHISWALLAGIGWRETNHGRLRAAGVLSGLNAAGCCAGPMQFNIRNGPPSTWDAYAVDGNDDGRKSPYDPADAIPTAARYLVASGAHQSLQRAVYAYNHAGWYVTEVLAKMREYAGQDPSTLTAQSVAAPASSGCSDGGGLTAAGEGRYQVAAGANRPGAPLTADLDAFLRRMAGYYAGRRELVLTTGTNHSQMSASGLLSDHWTGNGADFGMVLNGGTNDGPVGDQIAAAALMAAGLPREEALRTARAGGLHNVIDGHLRVQVIWKNYPAHDDHVHVGVKRI